MPYKLRWRKTDYSDLIAAAKAVLVEELEVLKIAIATAEQVVPAQPAAALLAKAAFAGLERMLEACERPIDWDNLKEARLILDTAATTNRLFVRVAEGEFQQRREDRVLALLEALAGQQTAAKPAK